MHGAYPGETIADSQWHEFMFYGDVPVNAFHMVQIGYTMMTGQVLAEDAAVPAATVPAVSRPGECHP
jgi:hypothetical protein